MKTYHVYHTDSKLTEAQLTKVQAQKRKIEEQQSQGRFYFVVVNVVLSFLLVLFGAFISLQPLCVKSFQMSIRIVILSDSFIDPRHESQQEDESSGQSLGKKTSQTQRKLNEDAQSQK